MIATAHSYVVAPASGADNGPSRIDRLSTRYLIAVGARMVEVAQLARVADKANKPLATLAIDYEIKFASVDDRAAFCCGTDGHGRWPCVEIPRRAPLKGDGTESLWQRIPWLAKPRCSDPNSRQGERHV